MPPNEIPGNIVSDSPSPESDRSIAFRIYNTVRFMLFSKLDEVNVNIAKMVHYDRYDLAHQCIKRVINYF